jgi:hypothetical protein
MLDAGIEPALPDNPHPPLVDYLMEAGPTVSGSMGEAALDWRDIAAWKELACVDLPPWQAKLLRRLSTEYLAERQAAVAPERPPPWAPDVTSSENRAAVDAKVRGIFGARATRG